MTDLHRQARVALPLAALLAAGCAGEPPAPANEVNTAETLPPREATPTERAQRLVRERLGSPDVQFTETQVYASGGAPVVCGRYQLPGQPPQRFIAVGAEDVFVESDYRGDIGEAVAESCRNG